MTYLGKRYSLVSAKSQHQALETVDCRRHGYVLTDKTLGTGAYAKVKLARVLDKKREKSPKLHADLKEKGHDMVCIGLQVTTYLDKKNEPPATWLKLIVMKSMNLQMRK